MMEDVNKKIRDMATKPDADRDDIIRFVKGECREEHLQPLTLGVLFELYAEIKEIIDEVTETAE